MAQFYRTFFERKLLAKRLKLQAPATDMASLFQAVSNYSKKYDPRNSIVLFRLPQAELKAVAMMPCPVNLTTSKEAKSVIASSKRLRIFTQVSEATACDNCPLAEECKMRNLPPSSK